MSVEALRKQIVEAEKHLDDLRSQLHQAEQPTNPNHDTFPPQLNSAVPAVSDTSISLPPNPDRPLELEEYKRYGRQMIVPCIGLEGQATRWLRD
jgi:adenylyltransferase/sulfurtransferase